MLLDDDVVTDRQAKSGTLAGGFGREERVEHLLLYLGRNARAVVAYPDFDSVAEILGRSGKRRLVVASICLRFALRRSVKAVGDQVEQRPGDLLREQIYLAGGRIKRSL